MTMPDYNWPDADHRTLIGKRISRVDSPIKVSGRAKYTYDYHGANMLFGKILRSPYAKAKIISIDASAAEKLPGVKAVDIIQKPGSTTAWAGDEIVAAAAVDESTAEDAIRLIKVKYQPLASLVSDAEPPAGAGEAAGPMSGDDIDDAVSKQTPAAHMIQDMQEPSDSLQVDDDFLKDMQGVGASQEVMAALLKARYLEATGGGHSAYQK